MILWGVLQNLEERGCLMWDVLWLPPAPPARVLGAGNTDRHGILCGTLSRQRRDVDSR